MDFRSTFWNILQAASAAALLALSGCGGGGGGGTVAVDAPAAAPWWTQRPARRQRPGHRQPHQKLAPQARCRRRSWAQPGVGVWGGVSV